MKKRFISTLFLIILVVSIGIIYLLRTRTGNQRKEIVDSVTQLPLQEIKTSEPLADKENIPQVSVVARGLEVPWALVFLPGGGMLVTERKGTVRLISKEGQLQTEPIATLASVKQIGEGGLHGVALHPDFENNGYVYLYYTYGERTGVTLNRVVRYTFENGLSDEKVIVDAIPGASNHDGGRIKFGPDKMLYITTGDAQNPSFAQDTNSLAGKILRVTDDGSSAPGNPFGNRVYSYGHRNPQGITWDKNGVLWETEHGPSGLETGNDEFNHIEIGKNYGWPEIRGKQTKEGMVTPILESGRSDTWAPADLAYIDGRFFFVGLRGQALYEVVMSGNSASLKTYFKGEFGRLREIIAGPDGLLYISTSNKDGRGISKSDDDKIIRINPEKL